MAAEKLEKLILDVLSTPNGRILRIQVKIVSRTKKKVSTFQLTVSCCIYYFVPQKHWKYLYILNIWVILWHRNTRFQEGLIYLEIYLLSMQQYVQLSYLKYICLGCVRLRKDMNIAIWFSWIKFNTPPLHKPQNPEAQVFREWLAIPWYTASGMVLQMWFVLELRNKQLTATVAESNIESQILET